MNFRYPNLTLRSFGTAIAMLAIFAGVNFGQAKADLPTFFRIGEKLSYNVAFLS